MSTYGRERWEGIQEEKENIMQKQFKTQLDMSCDAKWIVCDDRKIGETGGLVQVL
tara:strand:+ start:923 stop:1087 length:165 start_codon:yes stop_codon:yes gene_type:complete